MAILISLDFNSPVNVSTQVGDIVYLSVTSPVGASSTAYQGMFSGNLTTMFFLIGKDNRVNATSLLGYYADVKFVNDSRKKIELFSVGSEVSESSK